MFTANIKVIGVDDKRKITGVVAASMAGEMVPLQLLYTGVTDQCHPTFHFLINPNEAGSVISSLP